MKKNNYYAAYSINNNTYGNFPETNLKRAIKDLRQIVSESLPVYSTAHAEIYKNGAEAPLWTGYWFSDGKFNGQRLY